jgi:phage portal protein|uniref:Portal protein n=1 Tax=Siphoviridae sp. ctYsl40 TaxID=2827890 RepID=A0A8S5TCG9_9CAUD|nr:MAG TPA: portal protein [Siphoviridae sp. ctYsl40]
MAITDRIRRAWSAFKLEGRVPDDVGAVSTGQSRSMFPSFVSKDSIVAKLYNQIALDVASVSFKHVRVNESGAYASDKTSRLGERLSLYANIDQTWDRLVQELVWTMFENGSAALVAVDTSADPTSTDSYEIDSLRVGRVSKWYPRHVEVDLYDDRSGQRKQIVLPKEIVAIVNNPMYEVMNRPNSDLQRLISKLSILDAIDKQSGSGKLDVLIQLPYVVNSEMRSKRAKLRQQELEQQMENSKYGFAFLDPGGQVIQLNRASTNNLMDQVTWLTNQVYSSLGVSEEVFMGKATELQMLTYYNRTVNPILDEIAKAMTGTFLGRTARSQGQRIAWFRDPFRLVPMGQLGDLAQALTSAEIMSSNEVRDKIGLIASEDPRADELVNANINNQTSAARPSVARPYADPGEES